MAGLEGGQSIAAAARTLGVIDQTLFNWVKSQRAGKLTGADSKPVSAEQMEISRLRAELARVKMERDILGKALVQAPSGQRWRADLSQRQGSQYASGEFRAVLAEYGITSSIQ